MGKARRGSPFLPRARSRRSKWSSRTAKAALQPGWTSRAIAAPLKPLVINGVLFAASSGTRAAPAVLYAIDAASGKELWTSGKTITSPRAAACRADGGNVYVPGADGTLYAFGFEIEK